MTSAAVHDGKLLTCEKSDLRDPIWDKQSPMDKKVDDYLNGLQEQIAVSRSKLETYISLK